MSSRRPCRNSGTTNSLEQKYIGEARIFVASDHDINRVLIGEMLTRLGYEDEFAASGMQRYTRGSPFSIVDACDRYLESVPAIFGRKGRFQPLAWVLSRVRGDKDELDK